MRAQAPCPHATARSAAPTAGCRCQGPSPLRLPWDLRGPLPGAPGADPPFTALRPGPLRVLAATATKPDCEMQTTACLVKGGVITGVSLGSPVPGTPTRALPQAGPLPPTGRSRTHTPSGGGSFHVLPLVPRRGLCHALGPPAQPPAHCSGVTWGCRAGRWAPVHTRSPVPDGVQVHRCHPASEATECPPASGASAAPWNTPTNALVQVHPRACTGPGPVRAPLLRARPQSPLWAATYVTPRPATRAQRHARTSCHWGVALRVTPKERARSADQDRGDSRLPSRRTRDLRALRISLGNGASACCEPASAPGKRGQITEAGRPREMSEPRVQAEGSHGHVEKVER